jgi:hypothetical protein
MKMLDFVWLEDQALQHIDISLTLEQKVALESRHTKARDKLEGDRIKALLLRSEGWPLLKLHKHYVRVKPALHSISVITTNVWNSSLRGVALPVISILSKPSNWLHICQKSLMCTPIK